MVQLKEPLCPCYTTELIVSIPYGTIKRKIEFAVGEVFQLFQFLMVQLKVLEQNTIAEMMSFQFLMVQLKAGMDSGNMLSIVLFQFLMVQLKVIMRLCIGIHQEFQFLMVQLKASFVLCSLPSEKVFQFLMVQLKDAAFSAYIEIPWFQFLMVQLKVLREIRHRVCLSRFNSLWYN